MSLIPHKPSGLSKGKKGGKEKKKIQKGGIQVLFFRKPLKIT
jgi:hypothetical protein